MAGSSDRKPCMRCKNEDAPFTSRNQPICRSCYEHYIETKVIKRMEILHQQTRTSIKPGPRSYVAGLSLGLSSSTLTHILDVKARAFNANKKPSTLDVLVVHVDTDLPRPGPAPGAGDDDSSSPASQATACYRQTYKDLSFECVHLSRVLELDTVDWSTLPIPETGDATERLRGLFDRLPSATSRADVLRLLIRHLLLHITMQRGSSALILGHTTTALAALTLAEVANGRGFSVSWQVDDGPFPVCTYSRATADAPSTEVSRTEVPVYYPLRGVFKNEVATYAAFTPSLAELLPAEEKGMPAGAVVSHKDVGIGEIMARYFDDVQGPYSGIVANVVRTTGKLDRPRGEASCGLCGVTLDEQGDSRWAGEFREEEREGEHHTQRLCYGCKRSVNG